MCVCKYPNLQLTYYAQLPGYYLARAWPADTTLCFGSTTRVEERARVSNHRRDIFREPQCKYFWAPLGVSTSMARSWGLCRVFWWIGERQSLTVLWLPVIWLDLTMGYIVRAVWTKQHNHWWKLVRYRPLKLYIPAIFLSIANSSLPLALQSAWNFELESVSKDEGL